VTVLKSIVGLFLGLVIQLSQIQPCAAAAPKLPCPNVAATVHDCCKGKSSCPCASQNEQAPSPAPVVPVLGDLKLNAPKLRELDFLALIFLPEISEVVPATAAIPESHVGFSGVSLSVAFCTFVI